MGFAKMFPEEVPGKQEGYNINGRRTGHLSFLSLFILSCSEPHSGWAGRECFLDYLMSMMRPQVYI